MKASRRGRRMERHHARLKPASLNMVSLMDIFTILVFFLLVNSADVQELSAEKSIRLPLSVARTAPRETLVVSVSERDILVQGRRVADVADVLAMDGLIVAPLKAELEYQAKRSGDGSGTGAEGREITIQADRDTAYRLLKRIMATCAAADYPRVSLAVTRNE